MSIFSKGTRTIVSEKNFAAVGAMVRVRVRVSFRVGRQFSSGEIFLEPFQNVLKNLA